MRVLITGADGQLGRAMLQAIEEMGDGWQVIPATREMLDITDIGQIEDVLLSSIPDVVVNCAAYTAVDKCEEDVDNAYHINGLGPRNLGIMCDAVGAKLVHISTDYVFEGVSDRPWREDDRVNPVSVYGKSKLMGEEMVRTFCKEHFIIRTAWLYGEGSNFVRTMLRLAETNRELNVVGDQFGNPTYTKDVARVIVELIDTQYYGTYHVTGGGVCSWYDFACKIFELAKVDVKVNQVTSEQFPRPAKRPVYSALDNFMLRLQGIEVPRHWEEALEDYLESEKVINRK